VSAISSDVAASRHAHGPLPPLADGLRIYTIGDIHGRLDLLEVLLSEIKRDLKQSRPARTIEIFLGDYVDRGPQSREVIGSMIEAPPVADERICLLGNHEDILMQALDNTSAMANWLFNGGGETLLSYGVNARGMGGESGLIELQQGFRAALPASHLEFLASLRRSVAIAPYLFVHAGIRPGRAIDDQDPEDLIWIREPFLHSNADFGCIVVHGHTPAMHPEVRRNRINIDTGAVFTGCLTCVVLEGTERRFLQAVSR
jgi:serine/threonine protein phosphatase 1